MPKRGSCGSVPPGCRLSKQYPSTNSLAVHCCTSRACRHAHCTIFGSPVCRRPLLSRCPTSRDFVPWRFLDAGQLSARSLLVAGVQKPAHEETFRMVYLCYSITSSARATNVGGNSRPRALAVLRLTANANLDGW